MPLSMKPEIADRPAERGIALILVAVAVVVVGVFMALGLGIFDVPDRRDSEKRTQQRMDRLVDHLASFAHQYGRIPCPANPATNPQTAAFGWEARTGGAGSACTVVEGVVPFRSLGLDTRDGQDGWGRYFTYRVSPVLTNLDGIRNSGGAGGPQIFNECRLEEMWVDNIDRLDPHTDNDEIQIDPTAQRNLNPTKAKFCCPGINNGFALPATDVVIVDASNAPIPTKIDADGTAFTVRSGDLALYGNIDTPFTLPGSYQGNATTFAFVLVSHGENEGAFEVGTANRLQPANADEARNANGDVTFIDRPRILVPGPTYYDDFVEYRTQATLFAELGRRSCSKPYL